jgi:hypothetical protein
VKELYTEATGEDPSKSWTGRGRRFDGEGKPAKTGSSGRRGGCEEVRQHRHLGSARSSGERQARSAGNSRSQGPARGRKPQVAAAVESVLKSGDSQELERLLVGRRIWVHVPRTQRDGGGEGKYTITEHVYDCRVLSFKQLIPADAAAGRKKHLVQLWTDPGGMRTLSVGSIKLKDPKRVAAALKRHADAAE